MNGDETIFPGGLYTPGAIKERTDVYLLESGPGINEAVDEPLTLELQIVSGCTMVTVGGWEPTELLKLGKWICDEANRIIMREQSLNEEY